jgi:hypothetical protein
MKTIIIKIPEHCDAIAGGCNNVAFLYGLTFRLGFATVLDTF